MINPFLPGPRGANGGSETIFLFHGPPRREKMGQSGGWQPDDGFDKFDQWSWDMNNI